MVDTVLAGPLPYVLTERSPGWSRRGLSEAFLVAVILNQLPGHLSKHTLGQRHGGRLWVGTVCLQPASHPPAPSPRAAIHTVTSTPYGLCTSSWDHDQEFTQWAAG